MADDSWKIPYRLCLPVMMRTIVLLGLVSALLWIVPPLVNMRLTVTSRILLWIVSGMCAIGALSLIVSLIRFRKPVFLVLADDAMVLWTGERVPYGEITEVREQLLARPTKLRKWLIGVPTTAFLHVQTASKKYVINSVMLPDYETYLGVKDRLTTRSD